MSPPPPQSVGGGNSTHSKLQQQQQDFKHLDTPNSTPQSSPGVTHSVAVQAAPNAASALSSPFLPSHSLPSAPPPHWVTHPDPSPACTLTKTLQPTSLTWDHTQCCCACSAQCAQCSQQSLLALPQPPLSPLLQQLLCQVGAVGGQLIRGNSRQHDEGLQGGGKGGG